MGYCIYTSLAQYADGVLEKTGGCFGSKAPSYMLFDRILNVFGWTGVHHLTVHPGREGTQRLRYCIRIGDVRSPAFRICCMIDQSKFPHDCGYYDHLEDIMGEYEAAIKLAKRQQAAYILDLRRYIRPRVQGDGLELGADEPQQVSVAENTEVTEDAVQVIEQKESGSEDVIAEVSSTEKLHQFPDLLNRWVPIDNLKVTGDNGGKALIKSYVFPHDFFKQACVSNTLPMEQFMYGQFDFEMMLKVNSHKFQSGRLLMSAIPDPARLDVKYRQNWHTCVQRRHVFVDVANATSAVLGIPFEYHRTFVRNIEHGQSCAGVDGAKATGADIHVVSPIKAGSGQSLDCGLLVWARITNASLAGMSLRVPVVQGPVLGPVREFLSYVKGVDNMLAHVEDLTGLDKPTEVRAPMQIVPAAISHNASGKGVFLGTPLRLNPAEISTHPGRVSEALEKETMESIAKEWGYLTQVDWAVDAAAGTELLRVPLEPTWFSNQVSNTITFSAPVPPPVSAICRMMAYWTGTIDYRFDCVSSMHSGSFTVSFEFGRESGTVDKCQPYASYTHTFDLGERKTFEATAPYIFDTPIRRTATVPYYDHKALSDADHMNKYRTGLVARVNSQMFVRVANPLKAPTLASPTIALLVFVRAGHDFKLYSVIQNNGLPEWGSGVDAFPSDSYQPVIAKKGTRGAGSTVFQHREAHRGQPLGDRFTKSLTIASRALEVGSESADADKEEIKRLKDLVKTLQATSSVCQISLTESRQEAEEAEQERERLQGVIADLQSKVQVAAPTAGQPTTDRLKAELSYFKYLVSMNWPRYTQSSNKHWVNDAHFTAYSRTNASYPGAQFQVGDEVLTVTDGAHVIRTGSQLWAYYGSKGAIDATVVMWRPNAEVQVGFPLVPTEHNSIWDVLRRPVMIRSEVKLEAGKAYYVPCVPPQRGWCDEAQSVFDDLVITTPHVSIMGAFRFWRGEMRYTVINKGSRELYISHIPHSGTRMLGHTVATTGTNDVQFKSFNPAAAGLPFDVNHPAVNPITQVEVPYLTENVWCTINNGDLKQNAYWRDMMGDNTGHLVIYSPVATDVALLWAAGDRFRVGNFIGFSGQRRMRIVDTMTDDNPRVQSADFIEQDSQGDSPRPSVQGFSDYFGGVLSWGVGKSISDTARSVNEAAEAVTATMTGNGAALKELLGVTQGKITDFAKGVEAFASSLTKHLGCAALGSVFVGVVVDGWVCWRTGSPGVLAAILGKWLITIGMVEVSALVPVVGAFTAYLTATSSDGSPQVQAAHTRNPGPMEKLLRAIVSLSVVCKGARVAGRAGEIVSRVLKKAKIEEMSWCIKTWEAFAGFFSGLVKLVVTIWEECMCETDPEARTLRMVTSNNDGLRKYLEDANRFLRAEANDELRTYPTSRIQFYATVAMSMRIQVCLAQNPDVRNMSLAAVARNVIQKGNDMAFELHSSPVRFEPYVVCLSGPTNIGKSYFAHRLVPSLLKQVGWKGTGDPVYVRTPGRDFWDGYTDQPVILFDDMSNIRETSQNVSTMADLFALKSSALFNPNMAKLEEKNRRGNPLIVLILTNIPFPDMSESADTAAFDRRRDVMFRVTQAKSESGEPHPKVKDCSHLLFEKYHSTIRSADGAHHVGDPMGVDQFMESIEASWAAYHARETGNVKDRVARFFSAMNREAESDWMEFDPYGVLTRCLVQASGDGVQSGKGLLEEMEMVFDTYLEQIRCQDVVDYYSKKRDQPVVQGVYHEDDAGPSYGECPGSGPDDSNPYFIPEFFEGVPASEEMPTELRQGVLSALAEAKRLKGEYGGVDAEVNFLTSFALMAKLSDDSDKMARQRKMLGLYVGRCDGCASPDQFVFKMPCERGSTCHMLCVGCLASRDYFQCEHGVHKVTEIHASTLRVLTVVFLHLSRLAQQPVSLLLFVACRAVNTIPGFGRFVGAFTTLFGFYITLKYGFVIAGLRAIAVGTGISYISGDPQWARSIKDAYDTGFRCLIDITSVVTLLTRKLWATVKERFGPVGLVEEPDEGNPTVQMADERDAPIIIHSVIREVMPPVLMLRENYLDRTYVVGEQTYRRCYHYEFLKPSSPNSFLGSISWADQELAVGPVSWEDGHWEHIGSDGELHTYENKACTMTTCPMRCTAIVKAMCERQPALLRHTWQANLQIGRRYDEMPAQLLPDSAYYAMRNPMTTAVKKAYDWIKSFVGYDWLTAIKRKWGESKAQVLWGLAVGGVVLYGLVRALAKLANLFTGDTEKEASTMDVIYPIFPETQQQQYDLSQQRWQKASRRTTPLKQKLGSRRAARVQGEAPAAVQLFSGHVWDMVAKIIGNVVVMKLAVGPSVVEMIGIGVAQQCILLPKHYLKNLDLAANHGASLSVVRLAMTDKVYNSCPLRADLVQLPGTDCMMWRCPNIPPFSDIRKFFPKATLLQSKAISGEAALLIPAVQGMPVPHMQPVRLREFVYDIELSDPNQPGPHTLAYGVKYNYSRTGVCGSPLIRDNAEAPLLGFHVAGCGEGARGTGWAIVLSREEVTDMFDLLVPAVQSFPVYEPIPFIKELKDSPTYEDDPTVAIMELGEVPPNKAVAQPLKTKIRKSMIADDLGITPVRVPVPLSSKERPYLGTGTSPMYEGVKHYGRLTKDMPAWFEDKVGPVMAVKLMAMPPVGVARRGPLTIEQAVTGLTELSYYDSMNLSSSPGYPWCLEHKDGKRGLINIPEPVQDGVVDIDPLVRDRVEKELAMVSSGVRPATVFCDILKDEKKKKAQVETVLGKTRLVCMSPISFTIRMRMYFLHFFAAFMRDRSNQNHSVGISVYGTEWSDLVNRLRDKNAAKFWTLDYKNFGPAYATRAGRLAMRLMIDWTKRTFDYSDDDEKQMWSMVEETLTSVHIAGTLVFQQASGSPSGDPGTTPKNSLVNIAYIRMAMWHILHPVWLSKLTPKDNASQHNFWKWVDDRVDFTTYGDDVIGATVPELEHVFNAATISRYFSTLDITASDASKGETVAPLTPFQQSEFLKCKPIPHPKYQGQWLAALPTYVVEEAAYYIWQTDDPTEATRVNAQASLMLAYGNGREYYDAWLRKLNGHLADRGIEGFPIGWDDWDEIFFPLEVQGAAIRGRSKRRPLIPFTFENDPLEPAVEVCKKYNEELDAMSRDLEVLEETGALLSRVDEVAELKIVGYTPRVPDKFDWETATYKGGKRPQPIYERRLRLLGLGEAEA